MNKYKLYFHIKYEGKLVGLYWQLSLNKGKPLTEKDYICERRYFIDYEAAEASILYFCSVCNIDEYEIINNC